MKNKQLTNKNNKQLIICLLTFKIKSFIVLIGKFISHIRQNAVSWNSNILLGE